MNTEAAIILSIDSVLGAMSVVWLIAWMVLVYSPRNHPRISKELNYIEDSLAETGTAGKEACLVQDPNHQLKRSITIEMYLQYVFIKFPFKILTFRNIPWKGCLLLKTCGLLV